MFIFSILGVQLFGKKNYHNDQVDANRYNFQNFVEAWMSVFIILTGENPDGGLVPGGDPIGVTRHGGDVHEDAEVHELGER